MTNVVQTVQVKNEPLLMTKGFSYWLWMEKKIIIFEALYWHRVEIICNPC